MQIYLARNQVQAGPYTLEQLNNMLATNQVDLSDLMWHEGMSQWQRVGEMTQGTYHYNPNGQSTSKPVSVADLYGKNERVRLEKDQPQPDQSTQPNSPFHAQNKPKSNPALQKKGIIVGIYEIASIGSRVLATLIDQILALACLIPLLTGINFDLQQLQLAAEDPTVVSQLAESIPIHLALMTGLMLVALLFVQVFMLIRRGQSIGKLIVGIRILDVNSMALPSVTNIILLRYILTNASYNIPYIGQFILLADVFMLIINKRRRSLHDKLAKTIVVKADPKQLDTNNVNR